MGGSLIVVSAPSGTGKTTILKQVMTRIYRLAFSVSHTTRPPREGELHGRDYFFVNDDQFRKMIDQEAFLEWALVHGNYYGTAFEPLSRTLEKDSDIILDIDVQGAAIVRRAGKLPAVYVFIAPPSLVELEKRLRQRGTEDEATIVKRLGNARREMKASKDYHYFIVNDRVEQAVTMLCSIILAERARWRRTIEGTPVAVSTDS